MDSTHQSKEVSMKRVECNITIGDKFINIEPNAQGEPVVKFHGELSGQELAMINVFTQTIRCLTTQRPIDHYFNPTITDEDANQIVKCEWLRSGKLVVRQTNYGKKFQHALTVSEALTKRRIFTCPRYLLRQLPRRRSAGEDS